MPQLTWIAEERYRDPATGIVYSTSQANDAFGAGNWTHVGDPAPPPPPPPSGPPSGGCASTAALVITKAVLLGDSMTGRDRAGVRRGYASLMRVFRFGVEFLDQGAPGARVYQLRASVPQALAPSPQAVFFQGGINDLAEHRAVPAILADLRAAGDAVTAAGVAFVLVGLTPPNGDPLIPLTEALALSDGMRELARANGWRYAHVYDRLVDVARPGMLQSRFDMSEGVHMTDAGDFVMAEQAARMGAGW